jgi:hypothetical protein
VPAADGVYQLGSGITPPVLVHPVAVDDSRNIVKKCTPRVVTVVAVIGADGAPSIRSIFPSGDPACEAAAIDAIKESGFQPGLLNNHPVPVLVCIGVPFLNHIKSPVPDLQSCPRDESNDELRQCPASPVRDTGSGENSARSLIGITPPKPEIQPEAKFPDETLRAFKKQHIRDFEAVSILSLIVDVGGMPQNICLVKAAGYGLDLNAAEAVRRYRFDPARKDGKPVAMQITVEVDFKLY